MIAINQEYMRFVILLMPFLVISDSQDSIDVEIRRLLDEPSGTESSETNEKTVDPVLQSGPWTNSLAYPVRETM